MRLDRSFVKGCVNTRGEYLAEAMTARGVVEVHVGDREIGEAGVMRMAALRSSFGAAIAALLGADAAAPVAVPSYAMRAQGLGPTKGESVELTEISIRRR